MNWTPNQQRAFEYSEPKNVLLSAAAGSGKTAVLVQRVINKILDEENPVNINELLVLTFTEAAASEMKKKIADAIEKKIADFPDNKHLRKQRLLIHSANISTIHAFCMHLIRENQHLTDIPVDFSIISENEGKMMLDKALDSVLEKYYRYIDVHFAFYTLVSDYGGIKDDDKLRNIILSLYDFYRSLPYPSKWINKAVRKYNVSCPDFAEWEKTLDFMVNSMVSEVDDLYSSIFEMCEMLPPNHKYNAFLRAEYSDIKQNLFTVRFETIPTEKADLKNPPVQEKIQASRNLAKNIVKEIQVFYSLKERLVSQCRDSYPILRTLKNIILSLDTAYKKLKYDNNYLDFSDLEQDALTLLENSEIASNYKSKFKEILIDEYQDTSYIQDEIFRLISNGKNLFMVGDLKQSIYRFRNAAPDLFRRYYSLYKEEKDGTLISLSNNFRSREAVVDTINCIFEKTMSPMLGDVDYKGDERLVRSADYEPDLPVNVTELLLYDRRGSDLESAEHDALVVAQKVRELMASGMSVKDKETGLMRPLMYKDIVILLRAPRGKSVYYEDAFSSAGMPLYSPFGKKYLLSREIQTILAFLTVVDNPKQDIPLIAVMRSSLFGFTSDELAKIRVNSKTGYFYDAVLASDNLHCKEFVKTLQNFRACSEYMGVDSLIQKIYTDFHYEALACRGGSSELVRANLRLFFEHATDFEKTNMSGLFSFVNYINSLINSEKDLDPAKIFGENENVVRIMSIHKSKGLEFPVVILGDTDAPLRDKDQNLNILWDYNLGIAIKHIKTKERIICPSLPHALIKNALSEKTNSEFMRLLYVALTRAKEKLIITCPYKISSKQTAFKIPVYNAKTISPSFLTAHKTYKNWVVSALMSHRDASLLRSLSGSETVYSEDFPVITTEYNITEKEISSYLEQDTKLKKEILLPDNLDSVLNYDYPDKISKNLPAKMSVTEIKRRLEEQEYVPSLSGIDNKHFLGLSPISSADKGTITHFVIQSLDLKNVNSPEEIRRQISNMVIKKVITEKQAEVINPDKIYSFFASSIGQRLLSSSFVKREFNFHGEVDGEIVNPEAKGRKILTMGTVDCFFMENDKIILIDFKTDNIKKEEAPERAKNYRIQLDCYSDALSSILSKIVSERYIYFLNCDELIKL